MAGLNSTPLGSGQVVARILRLRWRLLVATARAPGSARIGLVVATIIAVMVGGLGGLALAVGIPALDTDVRQSIVILVAVGTVAGAIAAGIATGTTQALDPRVIATEPIPAAPRALSLVLAGAIGPGGLAIGLLGVGLLLGVRDGAAAVGIAAAAVAAWCATVLAASRTAINLLGLLAVRFPRSGQFVTALTALGVYGGAQLIAAGARDLDRAGLVRVADRAATTPPGQLGRAIGVAGDDLGAAAGHLLAGAAVVPALLVIAAWSGDRLTHASPPAGRSTSVNDTSERRRSTGRRMFGAGPVGAVAWRSTLTRWRTPRTAIETVTGGGFGLAAVLVPALLRDEPGAGAVLVGGAVQLAVLFIAGNSFGNDGPAIAGELLTGVAPIALIRGKARSVLVIAAPLALAGPVIAAGVTDEWRFLPAGLLVGIGGLFAGTGAAMVQSVYVPIAVPDSDNPFESGESGRGLLAALLLVGVLVVLAIATLPFALGMLWALERGRPFVVAALAATAAAAGVGFYRLALIVADRRWRAREPETLAALTPTR